MEILKMAGALVTFVGSLFLFLGAVGIVRMPDLYNRMQAGTKATTLGTILTLLGIGIYHPSWLGRMLLLVVFVAITNPISSHALARAAHFIGVPLAKGSVCDTLTDDEDGDEA
jgi:multicomponent Na+:H+ antiporter subunit G